MSTASMLSVATDRVVSLRYILRNRHNEVIENRMNGEPAVYLQGGEVILPALQVQLEGMRAGEQKQISLCLDEGNPNPDFLFELEILSVRAATAAELQIGYPLPVAADCGSDCDCYTDRAGAGSEPGKKPN